MPNLNSNNENTLWWQTALHVIFAPIIFIAVVMLIGSFMYIFGHFDSFLGFISRGFQFGLAVYFGLVAPTVILKKSNELVASIIFGSLIIFSSVVSFLVNEYYLLPKHSFYEWVETAATTAGMFIGVAIYYSGGR